MERRDFLKTTGLAAGLVCLKSSTNCSGTSENQLVTIRVGAAKTHGELRPIWRFFGADEPNYAYMKHGKKLLGELGELRPEIGLLPRAQPAHLRRRHAGA